VVATWWSSPEALGNTSTRQAETIDSAADFDRPFVKTKMWYAGVVLTWRRILEADEGATMNHRRVVIAILAGGSLMIAAAIIVGLRHPRHLRQPQQLDDLTSLINQDGNQFSFERLKGRTLVMNFIFTHCPTSCPMQVKALTAVQRAVSRSQHDRVQFVSVSMDPARDTAPVLKQYASSLGADLTNWSFVTGADDEIRWLHQHFDAKVKRVDGGQFDHRVAVYLLDANGRFIQRYTGNLDQTRLAKEIGEVDSLYNKS
jgi:protein SCO1/2